jgi:UDP-N-acetylmuramoyl-tripeptide--D-alanyl-D-alanine ligase
MALVWRRLMLRTTVVAISGSVGKTTAKECLAAVLSSRARTLKTRNNENDSHGVPRTLLAMRPWHRFAVIEVGIGAPGDMRHLARMVRPDIAIILSVARTHTNSFRTLEATAAEKEQLLTHLSRRGTAILNADDERVRGMADKCRGKVVLYGHAPSCDFMVEDVASSWPGRLSFNVRSEGAVTPVRTLLVGTHWLSSVAAALAASAACGIPVTAAAQRIAAVPPFAARMQPVVLPNGAVVVRDEETGSPDTLNAMLKVLRESRAQRRILVIGDISDSRTKQKKRQRDLGRAAAGLADVAVFVSDHGRHAARTALEAGMDPSNCHHIPDLAKAADFLKSELGDGDLVFVKGRTTDHLSRVVFAQYGSIGCWTTSCRIHRICDICDLLEPGFDLGQALSTAARLLPASTGNRCESRGEIPM